MAVDTKNLSETEAKALIARVKQLDGERVSAIPYVMVSILELADIYRNFPIEQHIALIRARNELVFMRMNLLKVMNVAKEGVISLDSLTESEVVEESLIISAIDSIQEILVTLQEAADSRLMEISPSIFENLEVAHGTLN